MSDPHILLTGERLALGMPREDLLPEYHRWETDYRTLLGYGAGFPQSWESRAAGWERVRNSPSSPQFEVVRTEDEAAIGLTTLHVAQVSRTAEFVMMLAPHERGKGYAAEAAQLTLDWGFHVGALRMVWLKALAPNVAGIAAYEKAGFKRAGCLRQSGYWMGKPVDEVIMDALPEDLPGESAVVI